METENASNDDAVVRYCPSSEKEPVAKPADPVPESSAYLVSLEKTRALLSDKSSLCDLSSSDTHSQSHSNDNNNNDGCAGIKLLSPSLTSLSRNFFKTASTSSVTCNKEDGYKKGGEDGDDCDGPDNGSNHNHKLLSQFRFGITRKNTHHPVASARKNTLSSFPGSHSQGSHHHLNSSHSRSGSLSIMSNLRLLEESVKRLEEFHHRGSSSSSSKSSRFVTGSGGNRGDSGSSPSSSSSSVVVRNPITDAENAFVASLTSILTGSNDDDDDEKYSDKQQSQQQQQHQAISSPAESLQLVLDGLGRDGPPRRVCQHPFRKNDIVWVCRTCQADETCVLCHACFSRSDHTGHDVAFYHAQAGGCCDCGDPDAWDPAGFCDRHGIGATQAGKGKGCTVVPSSSSSGGGNELEERARGMVEAIAEWLATEVVSNARRGWERTSLLRNKEREKDIESNGADLACDDETEEDEEEIAQLRELGMTGCREQGIYLSLHSDDFHTQADIARILSNLYNDNASGMTGSGGRNHPKHSSNHGHNQVPSSLLNRIARLHSLRSSSSSQYYASSLSSSSSAGHWWCQGDLLLWGTEELVEELGPVLAERWASGTDAEASIQAARLMMNRVRRCFRHVHINANTNSHHPRGGGSERERKGYHHRCFATLRTHHELLLEQRAVAALHFLGLLARCRDSTCAIVAAAVSRNSDHLRNLLRSDLRLPAAVAGGWHGLLLTLLAVPGFKRDLAESYCDSYGGLTKEYAAGVGVLDASCFTLSVQFLNREKYVRELVHGRHLLERLTRALLDTLRLSTSSRTRWIARPIDPNHPVFSHRRYSPCVSDLKCVLNVTDMPREFTARCLHDWLEILAIPQGMDGQVWRTDVQRHVDVEPREWIGAFNASISLGSLYERILVWNGVAGAGADKSNHSTTITMLQVTHQTFTYLQEWQNRYLFGCSDDNDNNNDEEGSDVYQMYCPSLLPHPSVSIRSAMMFQQETKTAPTPMLPSSFSALSVNHENYAWSFHYPLHRFAASCLRECARLEDDNQGRPLPTEEALRRRLSTEKSSDTLWLGLMEIPLWVMSRAAQIRAGLWKRNGHCMQDQVLNYAEPPFCRVLRDADLILLQFAVVCDMRTANLTETAGAKLAIARFTGLCVHRFGLYGFCQRSTEAGIPFVDSYNNKNNNNKFSTDAEIFDMVSSCAFTDSHVVVDAFDMNTEEENDGGIDAYVDDAVEKGDDSENSFLSSSSSNHSVASSDRMDVDDEEEHCKATRGQGRETVGGPLNSSSLDLTASLTLLEELLHLWIITVTELPPQPPPLSVINNDPSSSDIVVLQAEAHLRREVVHRLASGPKTHSELAEVQHVLSQRDNAALHERGRMLNPDDATGAALEAVLENVAERHHTQTGGFGGLSATSSTPPSGRHGPNQWTLKATAWDEYDPAFYHISPRAHQAVIRPLVSSSSNKKKQFTSVTGSGSDNNPPCAAYAPHLSKVHPWYRPLRNGLLSDALVRCICYRVLHAHAAPPCVSMGMGTSSPTTHEDNNNNNSRSGLHGRRPHVDNLPQHHHQFKKNENDLNSATHTHDNGIWRHDPSWWNETALSRTVHLYTLGAYVFGNDTTTGSLKDDPDDQDNILNMTARQWVNSMFLEKAEVVTNDPSFTGQDCALDLLRRIVSGEEGSTHMSTGVFSGKEAPLKRFGGDQPKLQVKQVTFLVQDPVLKAGAEWLCQFAAKHSPEAERLLHAANIGTTTSTTTSVNHNNHKGDIAEIKTSGTGNGEIKKTLEERKKEAKMRAMKKMAQMTDSFLNKIKDSASAGTMAMDNCSSGDGLVSTIAMNTSSSSEKSSNGGLKVDDLVESRSKCTPIVSSLESSAQRFTSLFQKKPQCIICNEEDDDGYDKNFDDVDDDEEEALNDQTLKILSQSSFRRRRRRSSSHSSKGMIVFCGHAQASTVLKGGGGAPPPMTTTNNESNTDHATMVGRFVGTHVALCGHAVHVACCDSYLESVFSARGGEFGGIGGGGGGPHDRLLESSGKKGEFRCPLCQRLSNCLVPFVDVGTEWASERPVAGETVNTFATGENSIKSTTYSDISETTLPSLLDNFLENSSWVETKRRPICISKKSREFYKDQDPPQSVEVWNGRCSFVSLSTSLDENSGDGLAAGGKKNIDTKSPSSSSSFGATTSVTHDDLFGAWNSIMLGTKLHRNHSDMSSSSSPSQQPHHTNKLNQRVAALSSRFLKHPSTQNNNKDDNENGSSEKPKHKSKDSSLSSFGVNEIWRRLLDQVWDVSHRADWKRLGEDSLCQDYGEFRHYLVEKVAYNFNFRCEGRDLIEWPTCLSPTALSDKQRRDLSKEKFLSKLFHCIQSFTYSVCSEAADIRWRVRSSSSSGISHTKYGIKSVKWNGSLILTMPNNSDSHNSEIPMATAMSEKDRGPPPTPEETIFVGRLGKLRYFCLAIVTASGIVARELVLLALDLGSPLSLARDGEHDGNEVIADSKHNSHRGGNGVAQRAPIVYPMLYGHVLTHVVAAMCAVCSRGIATRSLFDGGGRYHHLRSTTATTEGKPAFHTKHTGIGKDPDPPPSMMKTMQDCENLVKIGMLARALQVLLGHLKLGVNTDADVRFVELLGRAPFLMEGKGSSSETDKEDIFIGYGDRGWRRGCLSLLQAAFSSYKKASSSASSPVSEHESQTSLTETWHQYDMACRTARIAVDDYLSDAALFLQILIPGAGWGRQSCETDNDDDRSSSVLEKMTCWLRIESISEMMGSHRVRGMVSSWYQQAMPLEFSSSSSHNHNGNQGGLAKRLDCKRKFKIVDWPLPVFRKGNSTGREENCADQMIMTRPSDPSDLGSDIALLSSSLVDNKNDLLWTPKNCVSLLGGSVSVAVGFLNNSNELCAVTESRNNHRPKIHFLPKSYTDLYATLGALCPENEHSTALCLVCGETMNAGGKGECTKHAWKCGAGCGVFFLLQECSGLIVHGVRAAYVHSPYVDRNGETPQYRGRPLNLDPVRYESLKEMWTGNLVRERVVSERANSRQLIILGFY